MAFADTEHEAASFADAGSQATPQDFGDDGSLGSVPRGGFISATPIGRGKREVRIPTDGASVTSFDTALSPDRQTSLVSGLETLSLEAPSVTFVGTKRRHVAGAMTNTHAVRMTRAPRRRRGPWGRPTASGPSCPSTGSRTRARTSSPRRRAWGTCTRRTTTRRTTTRSTTTAAVRAARRRRVRDARRRWWVSHRRLRGVRGAQGAAVRPRPFPRWTPSPAHPPWRATARRAPRDARLRARAARSRAHA